MIAFIFALQSCVFLPFLHATLTVSAIGAAAIVVFVLAFCSLGTLACLWAMAVSPLLAMGSLLALAAHSLSDRRNA